VSPPSFLHLSSKAVADLVHDSGNRVVFCAPGLQQSIAAALINARRRLGKDQVRVVLDVDDATARMGYGEFDAVTLLAENDVDVRVEPGLRSCVLIADKTGFAFFTPPMLVEVQDDRHVGANAMSLHVVQVEELVAAFWPKPLSEGASAPPPVIGQQALSSQHLGAVKSALDTNPPQRFDLVRKVNVFNSFVEFVELRLTGLHIARHTVQLPKDLVLALRDDATAKRLMTTFKLVNEQSKVAKEAAEIDAKVRSLRDKYTRSLGESLGSVLLRSKRKELEAGVQAVRDAIQTFQQKVVERLERELADSRKKLVEGLLPAAKKSTPPALAAQVVGKPTAEVLRRYLDDELGRVFPTAQSLVGEMKLEAIFKGVTYETLKDADFQERVRAAFPYQDWKEPFREFEAVPATESGVRDLFG
jgi:hypothetical protein